MNWQKLSLISVVLACVFWNAWILGWLNHGMAGYDHMSISELNVINQPYYQLFTVLEYISGAMLIAASIFLSFSAPRKFIFVLICIVIGFIGLLTIYDSATPLDCNQYHNRVCFLKDVTDHFSSTASDHNTESIITDYASGLLSILVFVWLLIKKQSKYLLALAIALFVIIVASLEVLNYSNHYFADAIVERLWNVAVSIVFAIVGYTIYSAKTKQTS